MPLSPDDLARQMAELRAGYAQQLPAKVRTIEKAYAAFASESWEPEACQEAYRGAHSLAGSSGTYGFPLLGQAARALELVLKSSLERQSPLEASEKIKALELLATLKALASRAATAAPS
jgi:HPt (histidine-containing phosphotransfer) domain-containing protein